MRHLINLAAFCCLALLLVGCRKLPGEASHPSDSTTRHAGDPFLILHRTPSYPVPGELMISGLEAAVWDDGTVLRASSQQNLAKPYLRGKLKQAQMDRLLQLLRTAHFSGRTSTLVVDAGATHLILREGAGQVEYAESRPLASDSRLRELVEFLYTAEMTGGETSAFNGTTPTEWTRP